MGKGKPRHEARNYKAGKTVECNEDLRAFFTVRNLNSHALVSNEFKLKELVTLQSATDDPK